MLFEISIPHQAESRVGGRYTMPYDSTQGVPDVVFIIFWVINALFFHKTWMAVSRLNIFTNYCGQAKASETKNIQKKMSVDDFIETMDHPLKKELLELRKIIRESEKTLTEHIKWNAPSFCHNGNDRITFNLSKKDSLLLIFHRGAKAKKVKFSKPILTDHVELLEWPAVDRGLMKFKTPDDVERLKVKLKSIVKDWIAITSRYEA